MLGYLSLDIICSSKLSVFLELRSRKTVRFSEQIMSADKYPSILSRQMKAIVCILRGVIDISVIAACLLRTFPFGTARRMKARAPRLALRTRSNIKLQGFPYNFSFGSPLHSFNLRLRVQKKKSGGPTVRVLNSRRTI